MCTVGVYRICSNTRPGVYFLPASVDPALKRDRLLNGTGVYKPTRPRAKFIDNVIDSMASKGSDSYEKTSVFRGHHICKFVLDSVYRGGTSCWSRRQQRARRARLSLYLPSLLVLPHTWWPYPLPCYRKAKAWSRPRSHVLSRYLASIRDPAFITCMWLNLDPVYKRDWRLFEGGFYSSIHVYGTFFVKFSRKLLLICHLIRTCQ